MFLKKVANSEFTKGNCERDSSTAWCNLSKEEDGRVQAVETSLHPRELHAWRWREHAHKTPNVFFEG